MWQPDKGDPRGPAARDYRVVERVAYAHPVRDQQQYYAPGRNGGYERAQPPPLPPHGVGYPYYQRRAAPPASPDRSRGAARVRRGDHNSECVLYDPAESVVIDYVDGAAAASVATRTRSKNPALPPHGASTTKRQKPCIHKQRHPAPKNYSSDLGSTSEVTIIGPKSPVVSNHNHHSHRVQHHQQYHYGQSADIAGGHVANPSAGAIYMPGGHVDPHHSYGHNHHSHHSHNLRLAKPPSSRASHSSDTSSAYSGSDTMQSVQSGCENDHIDLEGLHESVVDSDEDLADSMDSLQIRDIVRDSLEKDPVDRTHEDIEILLEFTQTLEAFNHMTMAVRRALCSVMVFAVVEKAGTTVMMDGEELDSWSVIINGEVKIDAAGADDVKGKKQILRCGDSFGITPTMDKLFHKGVMRTVQDDCQFVCITQSDYYKILNDGETNQKRLEEDGKVVLISEFDSSTKSGYKVIRGTPEKLLGQLIDENSSVDPTFVEDFLLTHRTFLPSRKVMEYLIGRMKEGKLMDQVTRVLLLWVHNHFPDFETDHKMMEYLEDFEATLEKHKMSGQLRMLNFACAEKAKQRTITLTRPSRDEPLHFTLMGGYERGFGIFVEKVEKDTKTAEIGLKRGDQILEVNRRSFEQNMTIQRARTMLMENTHLEMVVKSNLLVFKEMLHTPPEYSPRARLRKSSDKSGLKSSEYAVTTKVKSQDDNLAAKSRLFSVQPSAVLTGKERVKAMMSRLMPSKVLASSDGEVNANALLGINDATDGWDVGADSPEHSLKIFKSDQHFKYLLVHQETSAKEVVMLALQEFGISELSSKFSLCEVTVKHGSVVQKRLPDDQTNLAERIGLSSRYYIKNIMSSDQLIPEDAKQELSKDSVVNLLQLHPMETATQLMVEDFTTFRQIEMTEYVDNIFELECGHGRPNLSRFGELVNAEMMWVITEVVSEPKADRRVKIMKQFIKIAHHCYKDTQNYNSMFAITSGLHHSAVSRLKHTRDKLPVKYSRLLDDIFSVMDPSMNFRRYRNLISNATPPLIPIYPMVSKDLTFIHLGNETKVEGLINFEKLRMIAKEVRGLYNMCSAPLDLFTMLERQGSDFSDAMRKMNPPTHVATMKRGMSAVHKKSRDALNARKMYEEAQMVRRVKAYLSQKPIIFDEGELMQLSLKCEPDHGKSSISGQVSTSSISSHPSTTKRMPSPSPSNGSTASSTSLVSEGKKSSMPAGASKKFGTDSPQAVRKLMSLSEPGKTRPPRKMKHSASSLHSNASPPGSPTSKKFNRGHERSQSDCSVSQPVSLSAESSSVTTALNARRSRGLKSKAAKVTNVRLARTISREQKETSVDDDEDCDGDENRELEYYEDDRQVSAV